MSTRITAFEAFQKESGAHCCNCGDGAGDAPEEQVWYLWRGRLYCPECAEDHGVND